MAQPDAPPLLLDLLEASGPSGYEEDASRVWREAAGAFSDVTSDTLGTSYARVAGAGEPDAPTLALLGHIDEIGVAITNIEDNGLLSIAMVGGISTDILAGQRLTFLTRNGPVPGVLARKRLDTPSPTGAIGIGDLHADVGARSRDEAMTLVRVGDTAVWSGPPLALHGRRLVSKALDNRLGSYIVLETARRLAEVGGAAVDVVAVAAVQEEVGSSGVPPVAVSLEPLAAIVVDVTYATDYPGSEAKRVGNVPLGGGPAIARGSALNRKLVELIVDTAEREEIVHSFEVYPGLTATDADEVHHAHVGVPTGLISIPLRYMHSPVELCDLDDIEGAVRLLVAVAQRVEREASFLR